MGVASGRTFLGIWASEALAVGVSYSLIRIRQKPYQFSIGRYWRKAVVEVWMLDLASSRWLDQHPA